MPTPEDQAREHIDQALEQAGWNVQGYKTQTFKQVRGRSPSVKLVASADKLDNVRAILRDYRTHGAIVWERFTRDAEISSGITAHVSRQCIASQLRLCGNWMQQLLILSSSE
ncbi:MAG: hypothetical protein ACRD3W_13645 [Terriglobales bacterium]